MTDFITKNPCGIDLEIQNTSHRLRPVTSESITIRLFTGIFNSLQTYLQIRQKLKNNKPDLVHLASSASLALIKDLLIVRAARRAGVPVVVHWHFGRIPLLKKKQNWEWKLLLKVIRGSTCSFVLDALSYQALAGLRSTSVYCIPNPLSPEAEKKARELACVSVERRAGRVIYVGHIIKSKGVCELVKACSCLSEVQELRLIGPCEESMKKALMNVAREKDAGRWLYFEGQQEIEQVLDWMTRSPVLALPSYTEGFPMVVLEAMAMGCTVVASGVGAIPDMLAVNQKNPCGICVPPRNVETLSRAISELIRNPGEAALLGCHGRERVLNNYSAGQIMAEYKKRWNSVLGANN
jgi:glycosyltransferase involved in cell wall biosynthesis